MTAPSKLDEARLRELAQAAIAIPGNADEDDWYMPEHFARLEPADAAFISTSDPRTILALLDALSAERERGDRAVGLLRPFGKSADFWEPLFPDAEPMMKPAAFVERWRKLHGRKAAVPQFTVGDLKDTRAFLATQKAEGAET